MNHVILIGRLARDVELSYSPGDNQTAIAKFTLAVDRPKRNNEEQGADFIRITVFGRLAENCNRYLAKGRQCAVSGRIQTGSYKNREGVTVYTTDVIASQVKFLGGGQGSNNPSHQEQQTSYESRNMGYGPSFDDIPDSFMGYVDDDSQF